ncbi:MAG: hypothetical protein ABJA02_09820 [Acidobacteriota bacterium]
MKPLKKALLLLLAVLVAVQVPFIYRRYKTSQRAKLIAELQAHRVDRPSPKLTEYRGIIHAHTSLGGHSTGTFAELIPAASANDLDFVLMTEHWSDEYDTSALTLNGVYGKTLFIGGNEIDTADSDRFLMLPGSVDAPGLRRMSTDDVLAKLHAEKRLAMITYPEKFKTWTSDFDGIEVLSLNTSARQLSPLVALGDLLWSGRRYPSLIFAQQLKRPTENIREFDDSAKSRRISLFFGSDAHSNIGVHLFGDDAGHKVINLKLDAYQNIFNVAQMHVLLDTATPLTRESLIDAVRAGHYYACINSFGDTTGFRFDTSAGGAAMMGDEVPFTPELRLHTAVPVHVRAVVYKNGEKFDEQVDTDEFNFKPDGPGEYRVEAFLDQLGLESDRMPWIMSNPIYVR